MTLRDDLVGMVKLQLDAAAIDETADVLVVLQRSFSSPNALKIIPAWLTKISLGKFCVDFFCSNELLG